MVNGHIFGETSDVCVLDSRIVKIVEIIEDGDRVPGREQAFNEMGANETCSASDQNSHGAKLATDGDIWTQISNGRCVQHGCSSWR